MTDYDCGNTTESTRALKLYVKTNTLKVTYKGEGRGEVSVSHVKQSSHRGMLGK